MKLILIALSCAFFTITSFAAPTPQEIPKEDAKKIEVIFTRLTSDGKLQVGLHNSTDFLITRAVIHILIPSLKIDRFYDTKQVPASIEPLTDGILDMSTLIGEKNNKSPSDISIEVTKFFGTKEG